MITKIKSQSSLLSKRKKHRFDSSGLQLMLMCSPAVIIILLYNYLPMLGIVIAFKQYRVDKGLLGSDWVGLKNFEFLFSSQDAWRITRNTIGLNAVFIVSSLIISVMFALMLNELRKRYFVKVYQTIMFFPYFISWVVAGYMLFAFLNMKLGLINGVLTGLGFGSVQWYLEARYWPAILTIVYLWKWVGYFTVIYYAGLMGIDTEYYEASAIDGASRLQMVRHISIPLLSPLIIIMLLLQIGRIFYADFGMFFNLTMESGILFETTDVIDTYVFRSFRVTGQVGLASAAGFYQSIVGFLLVMLSNYVVKKFNPDYGLY